MTASAPYSREMRSLSISSSTSTRSLEVPRFTLTLTDSPSPIPQGRGSCTGLQGMTTRPSRNLLDRTSSLMPSLRAMSLILSLYGPLATAISIATD